MARLPLDIFNLLNRTMSEDRQLIAGSRAAIRSSREAMAEADKALAGETPPRVKPPRRTEEQT